MKKLLVILLAVLFAVSSVGCKDASKQTNKNNNSSNNSNYNSNNTQPPIYSYLPSLLYFDYQNYGEEYSPYIKLNSDFTCEVRFNMLEWMEVCDGTYQVLLTKDEQKIIKINIPEDFGSKNTNFIKYFYLIEKTENRWEYFGEFIGVNYPNIEYEVFGTDTVVIADFEKNPNSQIALGEYKLDNGEVFDTMTIEEFKKGEYVIFDAEWYRTADMRNVKAEVIGSLAFFEYNNGYIETRGVLDFSDESNIKMTLFQSGLPEIERGHYTYTKQEQEVIE